MGPPKAHQGHWFTEMQGLLCAQYKPAGTWSVQQQQEKVPALLEGIIKRQAPESYISTVCAGRWSQDLIMGPACPGG